MTEPDDIDYSGTAHGQLATARRILKMDELVQMKDVKARFEKEIRLPGDSRGATNTVFLFSLDGMLEGQPIVGALLAGECMLVQARSLKMAERICQEGVRDTIRYAIEQSEQANSLIDLSATNRGITIEGGGRKAASEDPDLLRSDPVMKSILATEIGKLPWKH